MKTEISTLYYIQIGKFESNLPEHPVKISDTIDLEYMGSSEFEFGPLPRSLRDMNSHRADLKVSYIASLHVHLVHVFDPPTLSLYVEQLELLHKGKLETKETIYFGENKGCFCRPKVDFWWDIENGTMWTSRHDKAKLLLPALKVSFTSMSLPE